MSVDAASIGNIIAASRQRVTAFMSQQQHVMKEVDRKSSVLSKKMRIHHEEVRSFAAPLFWETSLRNALFSTFVFESGFGLIFGLHQLSDEDNKARDGLLQLVHILADSIPIDLYNAHMIAAGKELPLALGISGSDFRDIFLAHFPNTKEARDAVTHYHDRAFGRFRDKAVLPSISDSHIFRYGKKFLDDKGIEFHFHFEEKQFASYFSDLSAMLT